MKAKKFVYVKKIVGEINQSNYEIVEEELPPLKNGEFLCQAEYISIDAGLRAYMDQYPVGIDMVGSQVAKVIDSKNPKFQKDAYVFGVFGWRTHTVVDPEGQHAMKPYVLPNFGGHPASLALGLLGIGGNTAMFGLLEILQPKSGETVAVSAAAGGVGSIVGQIAKMKGCKVIGIAGSDDKCNWIKDELKFDHAINYKRSNWEESLRAAASNGIDCYFDNVGGEISCVVANNMNSKGRIALCGAISNANNLANPTKITPMQPNLIFKEIKMEGFLVFRWIDRWMEGIKQNLEWVQSGQLKYHETIIQGFENTVDALIKNVRGDTKGKCVVKIN